MTQLFRAAAPAAVPGTTARACGTTPIPHGLARGPLPRCVARATSLLALAGLAGCADTLTEPARSAPPPRIAASGSEFQAQYSIPIAPTSYKSALPWTSTGIVVPRTGKYRLRVQGMVTSAANPAYPGTCIGAGSPDPDDIGSWGPPGKNPEFGTSSELRVSVFTQAVSSGHPGFNYNTIDPATVETEQQLQAGSTVWVARNELSGYVYCGAGTETGMYVLSGSQILTVTELPPATLECKGANGDTLVERGQTVRCALRSRNSFRVLTRRASGTGFVVAEAPGTSHAAGTEHVWEGPAVATSQVEMVAEITENGTTTQGTYTASFTVKPRVWPKLHLDPPVVTIGLRGPMTPYPNGVWGNGGPDMNQATLNAIPVTRPAAGPNTGVAFLTNPWPGVEFTIFLHPAMYNNPGTPASPSQQWHVDQNGVGSGSCTQSLFAIMAPFAERHEGVTQAANSHFGITQTWYNNNNFEQDLEQIYKQSPRDVDVRRAAYNEFTRLHNTGTYNSLHATFDAAETPAFMAAIGCSMDFNLGDP